MEGEAAQVKGWPRDHFLCSSATLGYRLIKSHPDSGRGDFDESKIIGVVLFETCGDGTEVLELIEETLNEVAEAVEEGAERRDINASWHRLDIGPATASGYVPAQGIAVIGAVCEENLAFTDLAKHTSGATTIVRLTFRQLQCDRKSVGVDKSMDFRRQAAPRAPHAAGVSVTPSGGIRFFGAPFLTLAAC